MVKLSVSVILTILAAITNAAVIQRAPAGGPAVEVTSESDFCLFLPKTPGENIGASESDAIPFCTTASPQGAPDAQVFPTGFIQTAHFKSTGTFVQVTGRMDPAAYKLDPKDGGGQYDSVGAPPDAICTGFKKFVELVEPDLNRYCIRCCMDEGDCPTGKSTVGCENIVPGDFS